MTIELRSPSFADGELIPSDHAKDGGGASPPLRWSGVPEGSVELALTLEDPDAPGGTFVHWIVSGLDPTLDGITTGRLPAGAVEGRNGFGDIGYGGPRPPKDDPPHRYVFTLLALDERSEVRPGVDIAAFHDAVQGTVVARGQLTGRYRR